MSHSFTYADPPVSATSSMLDLFGTSQVLVDFVRAYDEQIFPPTNSDGPVLEFEFQAPRTDISGTVADLNNILLKMELLLIKKSSGEAAVRKKKSDGTDGEPLPIFVNNIANSLWQNVEVFLNGTMVSSSSNLHPYKSILEADLSYDLTTKQSIMATQGYSFEPDSSDFNNLKNDAFSRRHEIVNSGRSFHTYSTISDNFLNGVDKYLIPGVEVRIRLTRSLDKFIMLQPGGCQDASSFTIKVLNASLFVHLLELRTETFISLERALKKKAAQYEWQESPITSFLITTGTSVYYQDDLFNRAPACKLVVVLVPENSFTGTYKSNPFNFEDFDLSSVRVTREGSQVGGTPIDISKSHVRLYHTTMTALGHSVGGNGITLENFANHFALVFNLTADSNLRDSTIRPELTGARLGIEFKFKTPTKQPIRVILMAERRSVALVNCNREVIKNSAIYNG